MTKVAQRIGLVLNGVPKYSETFFRSKIEGLQALGYELVLFVEYDQESDWDFKGRLVVAADYSDGGWTSFKQLLKGILDSLLIHPKRSWRLFRLVRRDGFSAVEALQRVLKQEFLLRYDLDWLHFGFGMLAVGREQVAEALGAHMAVSFRGSDLYLSPLLRPGCYELLFKTEVKYHVLSTEMMETLVGYQIDPQKVEVISPAIDTDFFKSKSNGPLQTPLQLTTIARLHWKKGLESTLEALAVLKAKGVLFRYRVIGSGNEYERLRFACHQLDLEEEVSFEGQLGREAVREVLAATDVYLQYSIQEGFCNAVLEAQAMGCLCVVSNAEGLAENVLHERTGWVVPKRQPEQLAEALLCLLELPEGQLQALRTRAVARVQKDFDVKKQIRAFKDFYAASSLYN